MSHQNNDETIQERTGNTTAALPVDLLGGELDTSAATAAEAEVSGVERLPDGSALVVVKRGPNAESRFRLDQPVTTVGRHPGSDIYLDDVTTSRRHAEFRNESGHYQVVDTGSLNGTYVNSKAVHSAELADGDEIQIGKFRLVFRTGRPTTD